MIMKERNESNRRTLSREHGSICRSGLKNRNSVIWKSYFMNPIVQTLFYGIVNYIFQQAFSFQFECLNPVRWTSPILHQVNDEDAALLYLCTSLTEQD